MNNLLFNHHLEHGSIPFVFNDLPLIAIDFDGVINPEAQMPREQVFDDMTNAVFVDDDGFPRPMVFSPTVIEFFQRISRKANIVWLSTWRVNTETFPEAYGFPVIPWLQEITPLYDGWWKVEVVAELAKTQRLLWIDDEISRVQEALDFLENSGRRVSAISPRTSVGLTPAHLVAIEKFVDSHQV